MAAPALDPTIVFGEAPERVRSDDVPSGTDADALAPYGWCVREVPEPDGRLLPRVVALTWEELLNPREGEKVVQDNEHFRIVAPLADVGDFGEPRRARRRRLGAAGDRSDLADL